MTHWHDHSAPALHRAAAEGGTEAAELLRRVGCRPTPQRLEVLQALGNGEHLTAEQLYNRVRGAIPTINPSTVYRTLEALEQVGLVRCSDLGAGRMHFELARGHRHHHVVCGACGAVAHLHDEVMAPVGAGVRAATGYVLDTRAEILLPSRCPACADAGESRTEAI
jgi:Fur family ferric uptake transcriptional regulator